VTPMRGSLAFVAAMTRSMGGCPCRIRLVHLVAVASTPKAVQRVEELGRLGRDTERRHAQRAQAVPPDQSRERRSRTPSRAPCLSQDE
jgi:hypothetical protein